jgi:hypothetical protein
MCSAGLNAMPAPQAAAAVSASVVPGTLVQGATAATLTANSYAVETNNLGDWPRDTGGFGGLVFPISIANANFNGNSFGGTPNTIIAFGNGGGVTLKFSQPVRALAGEKEFGLFTAQFVNPASGDYFNGNMQAAVLVSEDGVHFRTLGGADVAAPTEYVATSVKLNAPTMAYDFETFATAWDAGTNGAPQSALDALGVADFTSPMPDDDLFNGSGTSAARLATQSDDSLAGYSASFGGSGGGNWFDISSSGLPQIQYVRLNGVGIDSGVRLDGVFANAAAVPEPASLAVLATGALVMLRRRRA